MRGNNSVEGSGEGARVFAAGGGAILGEGGLAEGVQVRRGRVGLRCRSDPNTGHGDDRLVLSLGIVFRAVIVNVRYWLVSDVTYDDDVIGIEYGIASLPVLRQT